MSNSTMAIVEELYTEIIKSNYRNYYEENYEDYEGDLDDFKEEVINELYNSDNSEPFNEIYSHLIFFLKVVKENDEDYGGCFKEWDNPQKVYELGMYLLATNVIRDMTYEEELEVVIHRAGGINWENYHRMVEAGIITPNEQVVQEEESSEEESSEEEDNILTRAQ
tara:strand:- start:207 stop:704 length:498 start_codon:yes stop_codon:yes gene_type:complete